MLKVGSRVHIGPPLRSGTGVVVHIQPPFVPMTPEQIKEFYELEEGDKHFKGVSSSSIKLERVVVKRDDSPWHVVVPRSKRMIAERVIDEVEDA